MQVDLEQVSHPATLMDRKSAIKSANAPNAFDRKKRPQISI